MVEPLGAASGVLGVAEVGFSLAATLYKYASSVKSAEKELKAIAKDVELTSKVLKQTHEQIQKDQNVKLCSGEALDLTSDLLSGCQDAFREVDEALKGSIETDASGKASVTITARMKWPLKSGKLEVLRANLEKLKTTLLLMLSVLAYGRKVMDSRTQSDNTQADLSLDKLQIQNLVEARDEATRRYEELSAAFARVEAKLDSNANAPIPPPSAYTANTSIAISSSATADTRFGATQVGFSNLLHSQSPANSSVSDCLYLCTSAVLRLATTIEDATRRWHETQTLEHQPVNESLRAAIDAVTNLGNEGALWTRSPFLVPFSKSSAASSHGQQSIQSDQRSTLESSSSALDARSGIQESWNQANASPTSNSGTHIPLPPPAPPLSFGSPPQSSQRLPPRPRGSNSTAFSRGQTTPGSEQTLSRPPPIIGQDLSSLTNSQGQELEFSIFDRRSTFFPASTGELSFDIPTYASIDEVSDDSDDGLFAVPIARRQQRANSPQRSALALKSSILEPADNDTEASHSGRSHWFSSDKGFHRPPAKFIMEHFGNFFPGIDPRQPISEEAAPDDLNSNMKSSLTVLRGQLIEKDGLGQVYIDIGTKTNKLFVVREIDLETPDIDRENIRGAYDNLVTEVEKMKSLQHDDIASYLDSECTTQSISIFQQYVSGGSIGSCLRMYGKFEESAVSFITRQILEGLTHLHSEGIFHCHLKADNILLDLEGHCIISEFYTSRCIADLEIDEMDRIEREIFWMAPEVVQAQSESDFTNVLDNKHGAGADIWSLGCVVFEMLSGRRPWAGHEALNVIYKLGLSKQAPPIPEEVATAVSPPTLAFMYDCFTIDPDERPSAEALFCAPMCNLDPNFNFGDTQLYAQADNLHWLRSVETTIPANTWDDIVTKPMKISGLEQPQKASDIPGMQIPALSLSDEPDFDGDHPEIQQVQDFDVVNNLLQRWTTIAV